MGHIQILVQLQTVLEIEYPENFRRLLQRVNIFQLDFLRVFSVQCYAKLNLLDEYLLLLLAVPVGILLIAACGKIFNARSIHNNVKQEFDSEIANPVVDSERSDESGTDRGSSIAGSTFNVRDSIFVFLFVLYPGAYMLYLYSYACSNMHLITQQVCLQKPSIFLHARSYHQEPHHQMKHGTGLITAFRV